MRRGDGHSPWSRRFAGLRDGLPTGGLRPDLVIHRPAQGDQQWLLIEVKGGERAVEHSARAALLDLLAYRRAYEPSLSNCALYGVGVAFGA